MWFSAPRRGVWWGGLVCVALAWAGGRGWAGKKPGGASKTGRRAVEVSRWEQAVERREAFDGTPEEGRTAADYERVMDGFRAVYHVAPGDRHAPESVKAVAELLAEEGRTLTDRKASRAAVGQYEFLRKEYPGSSLRVGALLAEARIEEQDLGEAKEARDLYRLLVKQYPRSGPAGEARTALAGGSGGRGVRGADGASGTPGEARKTSGLAAMPVTGGAAEEVGNRTRPAVIEPAREQTAGEAGRPARRDAGAGKEETRRRPMARVTGIRHWSTGNYTRVAIDLGDAVTYEAARVPHPDRIYFDLHGTRLAQDLVGKSFTVTDDGFLKKIRAAQFSDDMTRVVLDVNDVTEYSAFLLPNPYRLIIDIHGKGQSGAGAEERAGEGKAETERAGGTGRGTGGAESVPAPQTAVVASPTAGRPVPNTVAVKAPATTEVAGLSAEPSRVEATSAPTSKPISAVVRAGAGAEAAQEAGQEGGVARAGERKRAQPLEAGALGPAVRRGKRRVTAVDGIAAGDALPGRDRAEAVPARAAVPTAAGETSLVRALGLKIGRIVIDAGHGGHDSGTLGVDGIEEKDVVLDVALRLGRMLHDRLGAEVIYTRSDDTFIPLETRTAIANKAQADLFLSIHANSSSDASARGVETYYLNFTSSPDALETAARENAVSDQSIHQLSDLVKKIALKEKIGESREFASDVEQSLYAGLAKGNDGLKNRGVKKAPFVVLIGANMPSVLAEISFVTNVKDAMQLRQPDYRQRVAESLYKGVAKYEGGLSGAKAGTERASRE